MQALSGASGSVAAQAGAAGEDQLAGPDSVAPVLTGEVVRNGAPMEESLVTLHRVNPVESGPIDSVFTSTLGEFDFELPTRPGEGPDGGDVFFASVRHQGIFYFGQALNEVAQLDSLYRIEVYDTTVAAPDGEPVPLQARNLLLQPTDTAWIAVDLFRVRNDGDRTIVAREGGSTWVHPIPPSARNVVLGESDLAPDVDGIEDGALRVASPIPPGERVYMLRYSLGELPATVPVIESTEALEMLIEEPSPPVTVEGLERQPNIELEPESNYRLYSASEAIPGQIRILEGEESEEGQVAWFAVILALVLAGGSILLLSRQREPAGSRDDSETRRELLLLIAELDASFNDGEDLGPEDRKRYEKERKRLKARLQELK